MKNYEKYRYIDLSRSKYCLEELLDDVNAQLEETIEYKRMYIVVLEKNLHQLYREKRHTIGNTKELEKEIFHLEMKISETTKDFNEDIEDLKVYRDELQRRIRMRLITIQ